MSNDFSLIRNTLTVLLLSLMSVIASADIESFSQRLSNAALARTAFEVVYDGGYRSIAYPLGDVPANIGVCTDVVIRSYRALGIDLQQLVHEDMTANFSDYPSKRIWGLRKADSNIDHRRVPNLQTYFARHGQSLAVSRQGSDYQTGDLVTWMLPGNLPHIGIVTEQRSSDGERPLIVHNIGAGPKLEDMLFHYPITGRYRFQPNEAIE
ncbi:MAG: DUF1287 domain-containing protein [Pseudomonadales bacterium]|nr:DUF1287 domain-containing protein [Pseudomonadales bacterium]